MTTESRSMTDLPQEAAPLRPVSDEHRHEPADYELEPNELAAEAIKRVWQEYNLPVGPTMFRKMADEALTALTQAPRPCCVDERERCARIAETWPDNVLCGDEPPLFRDGARWASIHSATAIRSNSHD